MGVKFFVDMHSESATARRVNNKGAKQGVYIKVALSQKGGVSFYVGRSTRDVSQRVYSKYGLKVAADYCVIYALDQGGLEHGATQLLERQLIHEGFSRGLNLKNITRQVTSDVAHLESSKRIEEEQSAGEISADMWSSILAYLEAKTGLTIADMKTSSGVSNPKKAAVSVIEELLKQNASVTGEKIKEALQDRLGLSVCVATALNYKKFALANAPKAYKLKDLSKGAPSKLGRPSKVDNAIYIEHANAFVNSRFSQNEHPSAKALCTYLCGQGLVLCYASACKLLNAVMKNRKKKSAEVYVSAFNSPTPNFRPVSFWNEPSVKWHTTKQGF